MAASATQREEEWEIEHFCEPEPTHLHGSGWKRRLSQRTLAVEFIFYVR
jgi:hypothetical protein